MAINARPRLSVEEYFIFDAESEIKHEYIDGEIYAMTGGTGKHSRITTNTIQAIDSKLDHSEYALHSSDMRIGVSGTRYIYPDLSVVRGAEVFQDDSELTLLNPILVVEVTSPTSIDYDRVTKRDFYREVASIQAYLVIDQHRIYAELYTRANAGWLLQVSSDLDDEIPLTMLNCNLPLAQVYRGIAIEEA